MASSSKTTSKSSKAKPTVAEAEAARERSIRGWAALRALEQRQSIFPNNKNAAFSWWPGQESEVSHTQTR
eukprot:5022770-Prorocentrum_lima.AAC.1